MNPLIDNTLLREKSMFGLKNSFVKVKSKLILAVYAVWVVISVILAVLHSHKYATYFADLPDNLKNISPFVLSLGYLILFIPAIAVIIILILYFYLML
jgi:hypothetical protein